MGITKKCEDTFFAIFIATILAIRVFLFFTHWSVGYAGDVQLHHYMYGILILLLGLILRNLWLYAIGLALIVDELMLFPTGAQFWPQYNSPIFIGGTALLCAFVYVYRKNFTAVLK